MSSKKFSIVREIDISELNKKITECIDPYIFMNKETFSELKKQILNYMDYEENTKIYENKRIFIDSRSCTYTGHKLFIDNTLRYGEIELR
jgi:hypothetical protein